MKRPHCEHRSLFAILLWVLALTLLLVGAGLVGADEARADPPVVAAFRVVDFLPVAGETKAPLAPVVMAIFNLPVNTSTVTTDSFYMENPGGARVKAHFEFDTGNTRVFLRTDERSCSRRQLTGWFSPAPSEARFGSRPVLPTSAHNPDFQDHRSAQSGGDDTGGRGQERPARPNRAGDF